MEIIGLDNPALWDMRVRSFSNHDVYWLHGYALAQYVHGDGTPILLYYDSPYGRGICVLIVRDIAACEALAGKIAYNCFFDAVSPYGYGGFIFDGNPYLCDVSLKLTHALRRLNVISVLYRLHPLLGNANHIRGLMETRLLGYTAFIDLKDKETIWNNMTCNTRNMVRKAIRNGIKVQAGKDAALLDSFISLYHDTMTLKKADKYYLFEPAYFKAIDAALHGNYEIFYSTIGAEVTAMALFLHSNGYMHYHLACIKQEYRHTASSTLILYQAALHGCSSGMKYLHLGGGLGFKKDSLFNFKAGFNRRPPLQFHIGCQIVDKEKYCCLAGLRSENGYNQNAAYFPAYRSPLPAPPQGCR